MTVFGEIHDHDKIFTTSFPTIILRHRESKPRNENLNLYYKNFSMSFYF